MSTNLMLAPYKRAQIIGAPRADSVQDLAIRDPGNLFKFLLPGKLGKKLPQRSSAQAQLASNVGWVYTAATLIAKDESTARHRWYRQQGVTRDEWDILPENTIPNRLRITLNQPNAEHYWMDFVNLWSQHKSLTGIAYIRKIYGTNSRRVIGFELIPPNEVMWPIVAADGKKLLGWRIRLPGTNGQNFEDVPASDMITDRTPHPTMRHRPLSPVEAFAATLDLDLYSRVYGNELLQNQAVPQVILTTDQPLYDDEAEIQERRWKEKYTTPGGVAVLSQGAKAQVIGLSIKDLMFLDLAKLTKDEILQGMYNIPNSKVGGDVSNRAVAEQQDDNYNSDVVGARLKRRDFIMNTQIIPTIDPAYSVYYFEYDSTVKAKEKQMREAANDALDKGAITVNQYLERTGHQRQPDGDVYILRSGYTPITSLTPEKAATEVLSYKSDVSAVDANNDSPTAALKNASNKGPGSETSSDTESSTRAHPPLISNSTAQSDVYKDELLSLKSRALKNKIRQSIKLSQKRGKKDESIALNEDLLTGLGVDVTLPVFRKFDDEDYVEYFERLASNRTLEPIVEAILKEVDYDPLSI